MISHRRIQTVRGLFAGLACVLLAGAARASDWWNEEWSVRKKAALDTTASGIPIADPVGTIPILLRLHPGNFEFDRAREDGSDLRFVAEDNKTLLTHHIEKYDPLMGEAFVWLKVPNAQPKAKLGFWLYYGNPNPKLARVDDVRGTYDSDTVLVYHFTERGTPPMDATANGNTAQTAGIATDGSFIGAGVRVDEKTVVTIPASASLEWSKYSSASVLAWVKLGPVSGNAVIFSRNAGETNLVIGAENGAPYVEITWPGNRQRSPLAEPIPAGAWRHLAVVGSPAEIVLFIDGEKAASLAAPLPAMNSALQIGGENFTGELDEVQISKSARPAGFIKLAAASQGEKGAKAVMIGPLEQTESWFSGGYMGVIVQSLTVDGWVVICILIVMSLISWWVMISKAMYLNRIAKGNAKFIQAWHQVSADLSILGHADMDHVRSLGGRIDAKLFRKIRASSIYRIYSIGIEELRGRLAQDERYDSSKGLSAQSVQAIRATLDGGLVRETQKLNRLMVLLTIAISGGPFLGLLGTVVGVMITFAAIAQQGEVNVNSIAPGISAALAATVAGLAVAIPALFGYNYLLSRVKDANSDMHVFIDEFITKMAESFSGSDANESMAEVLNSSN